MNKLLDTHIGWVCYELEEWAQTFNHSIPEYLAEEECWKNEEKAFKTVRKLIKKLSKGKCTKKDYNEILFHLWQQKGHL